MVVRLAVKHDLRDFTKHIAASANWLYRKISDNLFNRKGK